jgi:hypothetical protein
MFGISPPAEHGAARQAGSSPEKQRAEQERPREEDDHRDEERPEARLHAWFLRAQALAGWPLADPRDFRARGGC